MAYQAPQKGRVRAGLGGWQLGLLGLLLLVARPALASSILDYVGYGLVSATALAGSTIDGALLGSSGSVTLALGATTEGVHAAGTVELLQNALVTGSVIANGGATLGFGSAVLGNVDSGGSVDMKLSSTVVGDVTSGGDIITRKGATIGGRESAHTTPLFFVPPVLPPVSLFTAGGTDVSPGLGESRTLLPGVYGALSPGLNNTLNLSAGEYFFDAIESAVGLTLNLDVTGGDVAIFVVGDVEIGSGFEITITGGDASNFFAETHGNWRVPIGGNWLGTIYAPEGDIRLVGGLTGAAYAGGVLELDATSIFMASNRLVTAIPEPTTASLLILALAGLLRVRHSRSLRA